MISGSNVAFGRRFVNDTALRAQNRTTSGQFSASAKKLFKAIDDENLEDFERALAEGANVNTFNEEGMTPLISIITNLSAGSGAEKEYQSMIRLLLLHRSIDVNIHEKDNGNTALHLAICFQQKKVLQLLLSHPNINTYLLNKIYQNPEQYARQNRAEHLIIEIQKAQTGRQLLDVLSSENFYEAKQDLNPNCWESNLNEEIETPLISGNVHEAKRLLNQELNPNCWKSLNGEIETPLSLIIKSCLQGITQENEEVLTKLLKHKELDFSQIKPAQAIERNPRVKQIIEQVMKERLTNAINRKDLGDVKKLVEDNCFMNRAVVTAALRNVNNPIESIENYLTLANAHNVALKIDDALIAQELQQFEDLKGELKRTKIRLREKEQELNRTVDERTRDTDKISQLERDLRQERLKLQTQNQDLKNKNRKLSEANIYNRR